VGDAVIDRAFRLLYAFQAPGEQLSLSALSTKTALPKPTTLRLARKLQAWGALERQEDGTYVLGLRLLELATLAPRGHGLRAVALPFLEDLHAVTGQHVLLAVREGIESILVERLSAPNSGQVLYRVGGRVPLHSTGTGLVLLAHAPTDVQTEVLTGNLLRQPEREPIDPAELRRTLAAVRRTGFATMRRQQPQPMVSIAVPLLGPARAVIAAISVVYPAERPLQPRIRAALVMTARAVSRQLGATQPRRRP
jgi:DNA-binding IclR family transcriptional regulator